MYLCMSPIVSNHFNHCIKLFAPCGPLIGNKRFLFLFLFLFYTVYYIYVLECLLVFLCNINHCNDSAPCWDLDWTIKSYLILSYTNQGRQDNFWTPGQRKTWPPPPILQIMILKLTPPRCVITISKESVQQK